MYSFFMRAGRALRAFWLQAGACLLFLVLLDALCRAGFWAFSKKQFDSRALADGYKNAPWTAELFAANSDTSLKWQPYAYWIGRPLRSRYFNINDHGLRVTVGPTVFPAARQRHLKIFMFGGSTMWGVGARDAYTIPSWLQRMIDATPYPVRVVNYGQDGYVSTQEMLLLFEQLRQGNIPDIVIFYDGFNDAAATIIGGAAGVTYGESNRALEFNIFSPWATDSTALYEEAALVFAMNSGMGRLAKRLLRRLDPDKFQVKEEQLIVPGKQFTPDQIAGLEGRVVNIYLANKRLIEAAGRSFGFEYLFFWQPTVWTKTKLTKYEAQQQWLMGEREFMDGVYERVATVAGAEHIHDLSGVFGASAEPYFIDDAHITEAGNRIVAEAMLPGVLPVLKQASALEARRSAALSHRWDGEPSRPSSALGPPGVLDLQ